MKKTFVMAVAMLFSLATIAQRDTKKSMKNKMKKDSMQMMGKDSLYMSNDSTSTNGKYRMNKKNKMKSKSKTRMPVDSSGTMN